MLDYEVYCSWSELVVNKINLQVRVGTRSGLGPIWAHMGPYGSSWTGLGRSGHVRFPTFGQISHVSGPKLSF